MDGKSSRRKIATLEDDEEPIRILNKSNKESWVYANKDQEERSVVASSQPHQTS